MPQSLKRTIAILAVLLACGGGVCPCGTGGAAEGAAGGQVEAAQSVHCAHETGGRTDGGRPESPCDSRTCPHCQTTHVALPNAAVVVSAAPAALPVHVGPSSSLRPVPPAVRSTRLASNLSPPRLSRPILALTCCFLI